MTRMTKLLVPLSLLLAACPGSSPVPEVTDFKATPATIHAGETSTLSWVVTGASQVSLDNGLGVQAGNSVAVTPAATTTYKLTGTGLGGDVTATTVVTVLSAVPKPAISSFAASPSSVATGGDVRLSWVVSGAIDALKLDPGAIDVKAETTGTSGAHVIHGVQVATVYTLTAVNGGGSVTATAAVTTHSPQLHLQYTDPTSSAAKLLLVRNPASTNGHLILDLKVGAAAVIAFGVALNLPLDPASAGMFTFPANGLIPGAIASGSSPATAAAFLGSAVMPNLFSVGVARKKSSAADGDTTWAAGATLFSVAFDMSGTAAAGTNVFLASQLAGNPKFRAAALMKDASEAVSKGDIAIGDFIISN